MDQDLVVRAQQGDQAAFSALAADAIGGMTAVARLILRDTSAADDAIQDALVDAWRGLPGLREPDRWEAWLRRLLMRSCFDHARRTSRRAIREVVLAPDHAPVLPGPGEAVAQRDQLERALARITPEQRAVIVLTYYLDLKLADAATALDIPVGTMKSRLDRARSALRSAIEAQEHTSPSITEQYA